MRDHVERFLWHGGSAFPVNDTRDLVVRGVDEDIGLMQVGMGQDELAGVEID